MFWLYLLIETPFFYTTPFFKGQTLYDTCELHSIELGPASTGSPIEAVRSSTWTEPLYGEGPGTGFDHVLISGNGADTVAPKTETETNLLQEYWEDDDLFPESRLATQIVLNKSMDGMIVYVPDRLCDDIP